MIFVTNIRFFDSLDSLSNITLSHWYFIWILIDVIIVHLR